MRRFIMAIVMLAILAATALPAMAQNSGSNDWGNNNDWGHNNDWGNNNNDWGHNNNNDWGNNNNRDNNQGNVFCGWYPSWWGWDYWCYSPWWGWWQVW